MQGWHKTVQRLPGACLRCSIEGRARLAQICGLSQVEIIYATLLGATCILMRLHMDLSNSASQFAVTLRSSTQTLLVKMCSHIRRSLGHVWWTLSHASVCFRLHIASDTFKFAHARSVINDDSSCVVFTLVHTLARCSHLRRSR